jgi:hypothetical protein
MYVYVRVCMWEREETGVDAAMFRCVAPRSLLFFNFKTLCMCLLGYGYGREVGFVYTGTVDYWS